MLSVSWIHVKIQEKSNEISLYWEPCANNNKKYFVPYEEKEIDKDKYNVTFKAMESNANSKKVVFQYLELKVINQTTAYPVSLKVEGLYFVNEQNRVEKIDIYSIMSDFSFNDRMDYKHEATIFCGAPDKILNSNYYKKHKYLNFFVVLKASTPIGQVQYHVIDYVLGKRLGISKKVLTEKQYLKRCDRNGTPIVLTRYNKQFFRKQST